MLYASKEMVDAVQAERLRNACRPRRESRLIQLISIQDWLTRMTALLKPATRQPLGRSPVPCC